jgi:hypothetical protein
VWLKFSRSLCADNLSKAGWSLGCASAWIPTGEQSGSLTAIAGDGQRFVVHADEKLTAFLELESAIWEISQFHAPMHS